MYINNKEKHDKYGNIVSTIDQTNHLDDENDNKEMNHPIWIGADKYKEVLDNAKSFSHKNKIGKFRFVDVYNLIDEIKDNKSDELSIKNEYNHLNNILNKQLENKDSFSYDQEKLVVLFSNLKNVFKYKKTKKQANLYDVAKEINDDMISEQNKKDFAGSGLNTNTLYEDLLKEQELKIQYCSQNNIE